MKPKFVTLTVAAFLIAMASATAYGQSSKSHFSLRSNMLHLNSGYSFEAFAAHDFFGLGVGHSKAKGNPRFSKKGLAEELNVSQVHVRADLSLRRNFGLAGPLLSFDIKRSEGTTQVTYADAAGCKFLQTSKGVLFSNGVMAGVSTPKKFGFQATVFAGAQYITSTPSYSVKIESLSCDLSEESLAAKSGRWYPEVQVLFGLGI